MEISLKDLAKKIGAGTQGIPESVTVKGISPIESATGDEITFLSNKKYLKYLKDTNAAAIITSPDYQIPENIIPLYVDNPYEAFLKVLLLFDSRNPENIASGISPLNFVHKDAVLKENVSLGPFVYIGANVTVGRGTIIGANTVILNNSRIGSGCIIYPNVSIMDGTIVGNNVILHSGSVLGADGFGFHPGKNGLEKIPQTGFVIIEDDVEIGANTCIDRAVMGATKVRKGTKIDNLVQIGHNVSVGSHTVIASMAGISGSTVIGNRVRIGGQAGFGEHIRVGDNASVAGQAGVTKDVPEGIIVSGYPAKEHMKAIREEIHVRNLPSLIKKVKDQEKRIEALEKLFKRQ